MGILRLKDYTMFMYHRYVEVLEGNKHRSVRSSNDGLIVASFAMTGQTLLFFNQSAPNRTFLEWTNDPEIPVSYQLKINHALSLLVDSCFWCLSANVLEYEDFPERCCFSLDLDDFRIAESDDSKDGLTKQFYNTCSLIHRVCCQNTRMREGLIRLIWSYIMSKELTSEARDLSQLDRLAYLRRLTSYTS